jgi:hypothetical protein
MSLRDGWRQVIPGAPVSGVGLREMTAKTGSSESGLRQAWSKVLQIAITLLDRWGIGQGWVCGTREDVQADAAASSVDEGSAVLLCDGA